MLSHILIMVMCMQLLSREGLSTAAVTGLGDEGQLRQDLFRKSTTNALFTRQ